MKSFTHEIDQFQKLNPLFPTDCAVFLGGDFFSRIPVSELAKAYGLERPVCNRSIPGLTLEQAQQLLPRMLQGLRAGQILLCLGEADLADPDLTLDSFAEKYEWLLYTLHRVTNAKLHLVSVMSGSPLSASANRRLKKLAQNTGCAFTDITEVLLSADPEIRAFHRLRPFLRDRITFADAMNFPA